MSITNKPWQDYLSLYPGATESLSYDWLQILLSYQAVEQRLVQRDCNCVGIIEAEEEFFIKIMELGGFLTAETKTNDAIRRTYEWQNAACQYYREASDPEARFWWTSNDDELSIKFKGLEKLFEKAPPEGRVFVLVPSKNGLTSKSIGIGALPLIKDNYTPKVVDGFESIVKDIDSTDPLGRLAIFDGPPGTGKTYLIRALLSALPATKFLLLPSNMADSLTGPELLQTLIEESESLRFENKNTTGVGKKTIVLVIEDADKCLSRRAADNISSISAILNLSDGIIGNLLDLRIVCTTNAKIDEIDEALMRTGRLSARVEVDLLDVGQAKSIYSRIGGEKEQKWNEKFYSLSDVYYMAKGRSVEAGLVHKGNDRKVGFSI